MIRLAIGVFLIVLPFLELILLFRLTQAIGFLPTVALMVASAVGGGMIVAQQSAASFRKTLEAASRGEAPEGSVLEGIFLMLAGILLIVPGLITDAIAGLLLIPPLRHWLAQRAMASLIRRASGPDPYPENPRRPERDAREPFGKSPGGGDGQGPIIEGEFERIDERPRGPGSSRDPR